MFPLLLHAAGILTNDCTLKANYQRGKNVSCSKLKKVSGLVNGKARA